MKLFALIVLLLFGLNGILVEPLRLLYSERRNIRLLHVAGEQRNQNNLTTTVLAKNLEDAIAVAFHYEDKLLFWTEVALGKILRKSLKKDSQVKTVVSVGLVRPEGIAIDWVTKKIYWTDSHLKLIEVVNLDGTQRSVLFWNNLDQPRAIVVDPSHGYMFWSDWGEKARIVRASMDGTGRRDVITTDIKWPNGLAVDYKDPRLFWLDAHKDYSRLESSDLDGNNRKKLISSSLPHPFSITIYKNRVFWTDWERLSIESCNKKTGHEKWLVKDKIKDLMDLQAYEPGRQPDVKSPCAVNNGGCSHLCLLASGGNYSCACPTGIALLSDQKTCEDGPQNFVIVARSTELRFISLDTLDHTAIVLPIRNMQHVVVIEYDIVERFVYWTDQNLHLIKRAKLDGSEEQTVAQAEVKFPEGIAIDWIGRNLYWSDSGTDRIEVSHLNGTSRRVLVSENLDEPRAIVVDPGEGYMYWSDWGSHPKLERAWLDGTNREVLVNTSIQWPNGLALDYIERKLYWADAKLDKIEVCNLNGSGRRVLVKKDVPHIYGFGLIGKHLYWTDWQRRNLQKIHVDSSASKDIIAELLPSVMGLKVVDMRLKYGYNDCQKNNGNCSHLCLYTPVGVKCECPMGLELTKDNRTCVVPEAFLLFSRMSSIRRISIDTCNGDKPIPIPGIVDANAVDFHINQSRVFWTDLEAKKISRAFINGSQSEPVIDIDIDYPDGLAVDWVADNLYWTDSSTERIECSRLDGRHRKTLIWKNLSEPHSVTLDPGKGYMYWTEWRDSASILRANMDGTNVTVLLRNHSVIRRPRALVIDFLEDMIYWTDEEQNYIARAMIDGTGLEKIVSSSLPHPYCLTQYKDFLYWGDQQEGSITRASKYTGGNRTMIEGNIGYIMDMKIFHNSRQVGWNECGNENGGCSHLCLALPQNMYTCGCPNHYTLDKDTKTSCISPQLFLLYSDGKRVRRQTIDHADNFDVFLPLKVDNKVQALEYDPTTDMIYWIDVYGDHAYIYRSFSNGSKTENIATSSDKEVLTSPRDIALDPYGKQLYWTDVDDISGSIKVISLTSNQVGTLVSGENGKPTSIAVDPKRGYMYWTNSTDKTASIEKARMNGVRGQDAQVYIKDSKNVDLGALVVDPDGEFLFFVERKGHKLVRLSLKDLTEEELDVGNLMKVGGLAIYKDYLYWVDTDSGQLNRVNKMTGQNKQRILGGIGEPPDVLVVDKQSFDVNHPCLKNNSGCSHLCYVNEGRALCSCPKYFILGENSRTCELPPTCGPNSFRCKNGETPCVHMAWRCDGEQECGDGSDEENCPPCKVDEFQCENKQCVPKREHCDGVPRCNDESDSCDKMDCKKDSFVCSDGKCIPTIWKCDGVKDCSAGSDEDAQLCINVTMNETPSMPPIPAKEASHRNKLVIVFTCAPAVIFVCIVMFFYRRAKLKQESTYLTTYLQTTSTCRESSYDGDSDATQCYSKRLITRNTSTSLSSHPTDTGDTFYNRDDLTGQSQSAIGQAYQRSLTNPPPSPVTDRSHFTSISGKYYNTPSPSTCELHMYHRPVMPNYTTPATTDAESSVTKYINYKRNKTSSAYSSVSDVDFELEEEDLFAPPPTICTNYFSERLHFSDDGDPPPSPSSEMGFIQEPDPPPPSPVTDSPSVA